MVTVTTNNVPRYILDSWSLSAEQREDFDYLDWEALDNGMDSRSFAMYRGTLYDLNDFERVTQTHMPDLAKWQAYASDTYFSGVVFRFADDDFETVVFGRFYCS